MFAKSLKKAAALAVLATAAGAGIAQADVTTSWSGAPRTNEEDRQFKVNGRFQYDIANVNADFTNGADLNFTRSYSRRIFIGVEGRFTQQWRYNVKFDLKPGDGSGSTNGGEVGLDDAYLEYAGSNYSIFIGQNNAVSHLEDRDSSNNIPFNERSAFDQAFVNGGKTFGVDYLTNGGNWSLGAGIHGDSLNNSEATVDESVEGRLRGTWAPIYQRTPDGITVLHLGLAARYRDSGGATSGFAAYSARPAVASATGLGAPISTIGTYRHDQLYVGEVAFQHNAFGVEAEYAMLNAQPDNGSQPDRSFKGGYIDLFWSPTGESRNYSASDGSFGRVTPFRTLGSDGGIGHVMLSARYDFLDLTDGTLGGAPSEYSAGKMKGWVAGVTWAPIAYVKFQANYSSYNIDRFTTGGAIAATDGDVDAITFRTQIDW